MSDGKTYSLCSQAVRTRSILRNTYLWMTGGLGLTGVVAIGVASNPTIVQALVSNLILFFGLIVAELILVIYLSRRIMTLSSGAAVGGFVAYAAFHPQRPEAVSRFHQPLPLCLEDLRQEALEGASDLCYL